MVSWHEVSLCDNDKESRNDAHQAILTDRGRGIVADFGEFRGGRGCGWGRTKQKPS